MKKLVCLLIALIVCALPLAAADVYETDEFVLSYPEDWFPIDEERLKLIDSLVDSGALDVSASETVRNAYYSAKDSGLIMIYAPDYATNVTVVCQPVGMPLDADSLCAFIPTMTAQLAAAVGDSLKVIDTGSNTVSYGDKTYAYIALTYEILGVEVYLEEYLYCPNGNLIFLTYASQPGELNYRDGLERILADFEAK